MVPERAHQSELSSRRRATRHANFLCPPRYSSRQRTFPTRDQKAKASQDFVEARAVSFRFYLWLKSLVSQASAVSVGQVSPSPLEKDHDLVAQFHDEEQMDEQPAQPGEKSAQLDDLEVRHGLVTPDCRHAPLIPIAKGLRLPASHQCQDAVRGRSAGLHRKGCYTWQRFAPLVGEIRDVPDDKNFRMPFYAQILFHDCPALAIE